MSGPASVIRRIAVALAGARLRGHRGKVGRRVPCAAKIRRGVMEEVAMAGSTQINRRKFLVQAASVRAAGLAGGGVGRLLLGQGNQQRPGSTPAGTAPGATQTPVVTPRAE